jgi:hypothetical protein
MLQVDHVYEFFYTTLFKEYTIYSLPNGIFPISPINNSRDISPTNCNIFNEYSTSRKIFFIDQEPLIKEFINSFILYFIADNSLTMTKQEILKFISHHNIIPKEPVAICVSEKSNLVDQIAKLANLRIVYYFFHGFAALDWYRGFYALNYNKQVIKEYDYDFVSFNRIVITDRSYRCYFVSKLTEKSLLKNGQISFGIDPQENSTWQDEIANSTTKLSQKAIDHIKLHLPSTPMIIDNEHILGSASANIPRCINDSFWHIVTETVFYYDKLHLTEKIFKPIVMKQPFMLLGAPGNLAYLKSYGFKTFEDIIDESYDTIVDNDQRVEAVVAQIAWYCALTAEEKQAVIEAIAPIVEYNFHHFYGEFKHIITRELLDNCRTVFKEIGYNDNAIAYDDIYKVLTT